MPTVPETPLAMNDRETVPSTESCSFRAVEPPQIIASSWRAISASSTISGSRCRLGVIDSSRVTTTSPMSGLIKGRSKFASRVASSAAHPPIATIPPPTGPNPNGLAERPARERAPLVASCRCSQRRDFNGRANQKRDLGPHRRHLHRGERGEQPRLPDRQRHLAKPVESGARRASASARFPFPPFPFQPVDGGENGR